MGKSSVASANSKLKDKPARGGGRPRSEQTRKAILAAALSLLERDSIQAITIEAISREAGVSKATIYRWWNSKASIIIDAFIENHIVQTPMRHDIHPAEAILAHWRLLAKQYAGWPGRIISQLLAEGQYDPNIQRELRERFYYGRRAVVYEVFENLRKLAPPAEGVDSEILLDMLYSSLYTRMMWGYGAIDDKFIAEYPINAFRVMGIEFDKDGKYIPR